MAIEAELKELTKTVAEYIKSTDEFKKSTEEFKKNTAASMKKMDEKYAQYHHENQEMIKHMDARMNEDRALIAKIDEDRRKFEGSFSNNWGRLMEKLVEPGLAALFKKRGIEVEGTLPRVHKKLKDGREAEFDLIIEDTDTLIVVEVKTTLSVDDVNEHVEKRLTPFHDFFHTYKEHKIYGAVASLAFDGESDKYAYRQGLFVITLSGEALVLIKNDDKFEPKVF